MKSIWIYALAVTVSLLGGTGPGLGASGGSVQASTPALQKITYLQRLLNSVTGRRLVESDDPVVREQLQVMYAELEAARRAVEGRDTARADVHVRRAFVAMSEASRRLPAADAVDRQSELRLYQQLREGIDVFRLAHARNSRRLAAADQNASVAYDATAVDALVGQAAQQAAAGDHTSAIAALRQAQALITGALRGMMHERELVHELDLDSPEAEYDYEYRRYLGYAELIPVAIENLAPPASVVAHMQAAAEKAAWMAAQAQDKAHSGDYSLAIRMMLDATNVVRGALQSAGVSM